MAPGNRIMGALSADLLGTRGSWDLLAHSCPELSQLPGAAQRPKQTLMRLSGTSVAAPAVAAAAAVLLRANPGLTPPLVKVILQYGAQPLAGARLRLSAEGYILSEGFILSESVGERAGAVDRRPLAD